MTQEKMYSAALSAAMITGRTELIDLTIRKVSSAEGPPLDKDEQLALLDQIKSLIEARAFDQEEVNRLQQLINKELSDAVKGLESLQEKLQESVDNFYKPVEDRKHHDAAGNEADDWRARRTR